MTRPIGHILRDWWHARLLEAIRCEHDRIIAASKLSPSRIMTFTHAGRNISMYLPDALIDAMQGKMLLNGGFFDLAELEAIASPNSLAGATVLDIGACIGNHAIYLSMIAGAEVIACEPGPAFSTLVRNVNLNSATVISLQRAIGRDVGRARTVCDYPRNIGATRAIPDPDGPIRMITLCECPHADLVKIDAENTTTDIVEGGADYLSTEKPIIIAEINYEERRTAPAALARLGYVCRGMISKDTFRYERK